MTPNHGTSLLPIVFRKLSVADRSRGPRSGEVWIRPVADEDRQRRGVALLVLQRGLEVLQHAEGLLSLIVIDVSGTSPTLDEMLAAWLVRDTLAGSPLPLEMERIASYASLVRRGFSPFEAPPEQTPAFLFQAMRNCNGKGTDLTDPATAGRFLERWRRLVERLYRAAQPGADLRSLFQDAGEFQEEQVRLRHDEQTYRQDVERGEQWLISIPDGPSPAAGLLLHEPTSLLFPFWSRQDKQTPTGKPYAFLAVDWGLVKRDTAGQGGRVWVFSTDPRFMVSLGPLAEHLQNAERRAVGEAAQQDPWFNGRDFQYTLIGAPHRGTALPHDRVRRIVRDWLNARTPGPSRWRHPVYLSLALVAAAVLIGGALIGAVYGSHPVPDPKPPTVGPDSWGDEVKDEIPAELPPAERAAFWKKDTRTVLFQPSFAVPTQDDYKVVLELKGEQLSPASVKGLRVQVTLASRKEEQLQTKVQWSPVRVGADNRLLSGPFTAPLRHRGGIDIRLRTEEGTPIPDCRIEMIIIPPPAPLVDLYVLAIGVSRYGKESDLQNLSYADRDAEAIRDLFAKQKGLLFQKVHQRLLTNEEATKDAIEEALYGVRTWSEKQQPGKHMVIVSFAGHGKLSILANPDFFFLPHDYSAKKPYRAISGSMIRDFLRDLKCPVVVLVDACHAGAAGHKRGKIARETLARLRENIDKAKVRLQDAGQGMVLICACRGEERAPEFAEIGHGLLTYAFLRLLQGDYPRLREEWIISLKRVNDYFPLWQQTWREKTKINMPEQEWPIHIDPRVNAGAVPLAVNPIRIAPQTPVGSGK